MGIPELALLLAGFALAHAAWSISDVPSGELLVPVSVTAKAEGAPLRIARYEASTQAEAIEKAMAATSAIWRTGEPWAFVREGLLPENGTKVDVLLVDFWGPGMDTSITVIQRFRPAWSPGGFRLIGPPFVTIDGRLQPDSAVAPLLEGILEGVRQHGKAGPLWNAWHAKE
jgi:hypothetical protein